MRPGTDSLDITRLTANRQRPDREMSPDVRDDASADYRAEFASRFTSAMRAKSALNPRSLRVYDVVDVFADSGEFLFRGTVEARDETGHVQVRHLTDSESRRTALKIVRIENCRYADAMSPPATLRQWEADRGVETSVPPY
jgi:hypothetical protein